MLISGHFGTPQQGRIIAYGPAHMAAAEDMINRLVKIARGDRPLSPWYRRQLAPYQRKTALRIAAKQTPFISESDVLAIFKIAKGL